MMKTTTVDAAGTVVTAAETTVTKTREPTANPASASILRTLHQLLHAQDFAGHQATREMDFVTTTTTTVDASMMAATAVENLVKKVNTSTAKIVLARTQQDRAFPNLHKKRAQEHALLAAATGVMDTVTMPTITADANTMVEIAAGSHKKANFNIVKIVRAETQQRTTQHKGNCALEYALQAVVSREMDTVMIPTTTVVVNMMVATAAVLASKANFSTAKLALARTQKGNPSHKQDKPAQGHA